MQMEMGRGGSGLFFDLFVSWLPPFLMLWGCDG